MEDSPSNRPARLQELNDAIAAIDREILELVHRRGVKLTELVNESDAPRGARLAVELDRIGTLVGPDSDGLTAESKTELLRHIASLSLESIAETQAAYLGPRFSYSHLAALKYFGDAANLTPVASIPSVFDAVERGDTGAGIVPIENSTDGRVVDTLGMFVRREMTICGEVLLPIHHYLLSSTPRAEIVEVHSKPQAISQCRDWLARHLPAARLVETGSTAGAAKLASTRHGVAAIASQEAGREHGLEVIEPCIEDNPNNVTRFAVLGTEQPDPTGHDKTALLFQVDHRPGALADAMTIFKQQQLNLTWIESFPAPGATNEYLFFVELAGHQRDRPVAAAIDQLRLDTTRLTVLGSYPRAE